VPSVPRRLRRARHRYSSVKRAGATGYAAAQALLAYAYVLEFHADHSADASLDARDLLGACIRQLDAAVLWGEAPVPMLEEYVASLDEQTMYIEVALRVRASRMDARGFASRRRSRSTPCSLPTVATLS
jgi:hypothetical protein